MSQTERATRRVVVKLTPRTPSAEKTVLPPSAERMGLLGDRLNLQGGREGLLGEYYDNLERTVVELSQARQFLQCYRQVGR